MSELKRAGR